MLLFTTPEKSQMARLTKATLSALGLVSLLALSACGMRQNSESAISFSNFQKLEAASGTDTVAALSSCTDAPNPDFSGKSCLKIRQEFRYVVYVGKQIYCYWDEKKLETGTDFDALAKALESRINDQITYSQYFADVLTAWAASFHDGHVNPMLGDDRSKLEVLHSNVRLRLLAAGTDHEKLFVQASKNPQFPVGSQILKVNGLEIKDMLTFREQMVSGSTRRMRRFGAGMRLFDSVGIDHAMEPFEVEYQPPGSGPHKIVSVTRKLEVVLPPKPGEKDIEKTGEANVLAEVLPGKIGYLKIDLFAGTELPAIFDAKMAQLRQTSGLILDVRENGGGDLSGNRILRWLTRTKIARYFISPRRSDFLLVNRPEFFAMGVNPTDDRFTEWSSVDVEPTSVTDGTFAGKPIVALTSNYCFSACDTFVAALKANGLAKIIGEATGGGTGTPEVFDLPISELKFRYAVVRGQTAKHDWIEGAGTTPDVVAEYTEGDIANEPMTDSQTTQAVAYISTVLNQTPPTITARPAQDPSLAPAKSPDISATTEELLKLKILEKIHED
jgi:carboxyl-terminal processing protease